MHLLDGGFSSVPYFRLQASGTYLADFHPTGFALIELTAYHNEYLGKRHLKDELGVRFPQSHSFLYRGDVFLFLHGNADFNGFSALAEEFQLKVVMFDGINDLFDLPALYRTAHEALMLMTDRRFHSGNVCTVAQLRTPLLLKNLEGRSDLIAKEIRAPCRTRQGKGHTVLRNALLLSDLLSFAEKDLRRSFYSSQYGALPYSQNKG